MQNLSLRPSGKKFWWDFLGSSGIKMDFLSLLDWDYMDIRYQQKSDKLLSNWIGATTSRTEGQAPIKPNLSKAGFPMSPSSLAALSCSYHKWEDLRNSVLWLIKLKRWAFRGQRWMAGLSRRVGWGDRCGGAAARVIGQSVPGFCRAAPDWAPSIFLIRLSPKAGGAGPEPKRIIKSRRSGARGWATGQARDEGGLGRPLPL